MHHGINKPTHLRNNLKYILMGQICNFLLTLLKIAMIGKSKILKIVSIDSIENFGIVRNTFYFASLINSNLNNTGTLFESSPIVPYKSVSLRSNRSC